MAGSNEIRQKIVLEGEKQYRDAIRDAQRNLKTLRSELKAETAELGTNASAQQKNEVRVKSLKAMIAEQEKIVKANRDALEEIRQKYGDNADALAQYEQRLNDSRTALANMRNELSSVDQSFRQVQGSAEMSAVAAHSVADSFGKLSEVGEKISSSIETAMGNVVSRVKESIAAVWESIVDLAARSNGLVDLAGFWNTNVTTIQKYKGAAADISASLEDLSGIVTKINALDEKKVTELTGVSGGNYSDRWEYAMAVMDAMSEMSVEERNATGFELFGRGATKAFDMLNDWSTLQESLAKYDVENGGYGLTEEELNQMSDLYDKVNGLKESWQMLKDMATVKLFGDLAFQITGDAQGVVDALKDYFNADSDEERAAAIEKVKENVKEMFEAVAQAIRDGIQMIGKLAEELQESDDPAVQAVGGILSALQTSLQWMVDNSDKVVLALESIFGIWLLSKAATFANTLLSIATYLGSISAFKMPAGLPSLFGGGTPTTPTTPTAPADAATGAATGGGIFGGLIAKGKAALSSLGKFFTSTGAKVGGALLSFLWAMMPNNPLFAQSGNSEDDPVWQAAKAAADKKDAGQKLTPEEEALLNPRQTSLKYWQTPEKVEEREARERAQASEDLERIPMSERKHELEMSPLQKAAEAYWDVFRNPNTRVDENWAAQDTFLEALGGNVDLMNRLIEKMMELDGYYGGPENLPSSWFTDPSMWMPGGGASGETDGMTSGDAKSMTDAVNKLPGEVRRGLTGVKIYMDKTIVGQLVAEEVSRQIAASIV